MRGCVVSGGGEAVVALRVHGPAGRHAGEGNSSEAVEVEAGIDTGFTGHLTLPRAMVRSLALPRRGFVDVELDDGRMTALDVYEARVLWHGRPRPIPVYETGETGGPLVGMSLLRGSRLEAGAAPGGEVVIRPLPLSLPRSSVICNQPTLLYVVTRRQEGLFVGRV